VLRGAVFAAALAWAVLDLRWLDDLSAKHRLTASIYAGKSWAEQARLQPDEDVAGFAQLVRQHLADPALQRRVLVASDSTYTMLRLIYLLLPLNTAPLESAVNALPASQWPADAVIVLCASKRWHFDESSSMLVSEGRTVAATPLFAGGNLSIYRVRGANR